jgi:hypothetical protein
LLSRSSTRQPGRERGDEAPAVGVEAADHDAATFAIAGMPGSAGNV